jgi:hypothetical protein
VREKEQNKQTGEEKTRKEERKNRQFTTTVTLKTDKNVFFFTSTRMIVIIRGTYLHL